MGATPRTRWLRLSALACFRTRAGPRCGDWRVRSQIWGRTPPVSCVLYTTHSRTRRLRGYCAAARPACEVVDEESKHPQAPVPPRFASREEPRTPTALFSPRAAAQHSTAHINHLCLTWKIPPERTSGLDDCQSYVQHQMQASCGGAGTPCNCHRMGHMNTQHHRPPQRVRSGAWCSQRESASEFDCEFDFDAVNSKIKNHMGMGAPTRPPRAPSKEHRRSPHRARVYATSPVSPQSPPLPTNRSTRPPALQLRPVGPTPEPPRL